MIDKEKIVKYASIGILSMSLAGVSIHSSLVNEIVVEKDSSNLDTLVEYNVSDNFILDGTHAYNKKKSVEYSVADNFILVGTHGYNKNSLKEMGLVDATFTPNEGYYLQEHKTFKGYYYVVENGYQIVDGEKVLIDTINNMSR